MKYVSAVARSLLAKQTSYQKSSIEEVRESMLPMTVLADRTFGIDDEGDMDSVESFFEFAATTHLHDDDVGIQLQLPLENPGQILAHYRYMIRRYERAYERMAMFALKWHHLMDDVENDPTIKKMFTDMQIMRKLSRNSVV